MPECNLEKNSGKIFFPERYQEIYSSSTSKTRSFVCKNGYTNGGTPITVQPTSNKQAKPCITTNMCTPIQFKVPHIIRPGGTDNYECTLSGNKFSRVNVTDLKHCLLKNRSHNTQNDC